MKTPATPARNKYLRMALVAAALSLFSILTIITAVKSGDRFRIFMRVVILVIGLTYTGVYIYHYIKLKNRAEK